MEARPGRTDGSARARAAGGAQAERPGAERLLLGDWGRVVRDPLDLLRIAFGVAALAFALAGDTDGALRFGATFLALVLARYLDLPRPFDLAVAVAGLLQTLGYALGFFERFGWWDELLHAVMPAVATTLFYLALVRNGASIELAERRTGPRHRYLGIVATAAGLGVTVGALYEIYEWVAVNWIGVTYRIGYGDTIADLALDVGSSLVGGALLVAWAEFGWGTVRRRRVSAGSAA